MDVTVDAQPGVLRDMRDLARAFAARHGVAAPDDVALAVGEACGNVIAHAYRDVAPGPLRLTGNTADGTVWIGIADRGSGMIPPGALPHSGGMGLAIIAGLADHFELRGGKAQEGVWIRMGFVATAGGTRSADAGR